MKFINKRIEMLAHTEEDGIIHPLKFRIEQKDGQKHTYDILKVKSVHFEKLSGNRMYRYHCEIEVSGAIRPCEIKYELDTCIWTLFHI